MLGMPVTYYMSAEYDTVSLIIPDNNSILHLDSSGNWSITAYDLGINYKYRFNCIVSLSKTSFTTSDIGIVDIGVRIEDRCGNIVQDTLSVKISAYSAVSIDEMKASENNVLVYTNPATDYVVVEGKDIEELEMYSIDGVLI